MVAEISRVNQWMWSVLSGDSTLSTAVSGRIYADEAPQGALTPMVIFAYLGGAERLRPFHDRRFTTALYLVRAIADGSSYEAIETIADRIDSLLTVGDQGTVVRDVRISSCQREQPHQRKDSENGKPVVYLGGFYRLFFQPLSQ